MTPTPTSSASAAELRECPFCGATNIECGEISDTKWYVGCGTCDSGTEGFSRADARTRWNRRDAAPVSSSVDAQAIACGPECVDCGARLLGDENRIYAANGFGDERGPICESCSNNYPVEDDPETQEAWNDAEIIAAWDRKKTMPRIDQLRAFVEFERKHHPGKRHIAEWALEMIESAAPKDAQAAAAQVTLNPATESLVQRFADALRTKLAAAEAKYGYTDGWARDDWREECQAHLVEHVAKGDPRDVAAYCAFAWHHGWSTRTDAPAAAAQYYYCERAKVTWIPQETHDRPCGMCRPIVAPKSAQVMEQLVLALCNAYDAAQSSKTELAEYPSMYAALEAVAPLLAQPAAMEARYIGIPCEAKDESHEYKPAIFLGVDSCGYEPMIQFPGRMPWFSMWHSVRGLDRDAICKHYRALYAAPPAQPDAPVSCGNNPSCGSTEVVFTADGDMQCSKCGHPMSVSQTDAHAGEVVTVPREPTDAMVESAIEMLAAVRNAFPGERAKFLSDETLVCVVYDGMVAGRNVEAAIRRSSAGSQGARDAEGGK